MSSGRSARLPPTPTPTSTQNANNKHRVAAATSAVAATAVGEPNSNNMLQYSSGNATANGSAGTASGLGVSGLQMASMNMGMGSMSSGMLPSGFGLGQMSGGVSTATSDVGTDSIPGETIDALGPELAVATSQVLENLSENERKMIIEVLNRDESVRQRDATRIM
ncbi:hypothetical protein AWZ03_003125 [Drosophila navojoa]|uniref:Uncharacterized protein n=2 Tax=Drosophila navojoa TaxID=7232 RepID=A0A484BNU2_DRONA|nr:hypothetical protein AWZ03_003125 [Drosophila navojoa]